MGKADACDVFLSYARSDAAVAQQLYVWLRDEQGLHPFIDSVDLDPGKPWMPAIEDAIGRCKAVAILFKDKIGDTQQYERQFAVIRQTREPTFPVIPVLLPGCGSPPTGFLTLLTWVDLSSKPDILDQRETLAKLRAAIRGEPIAAPDIRAQVCPYRGLEPFREEDAAFFCGRDDAIRDLVAKVQAHSFVAVVGPSGSGKSSLVFAGLLPELRRQREHDVETWSRCARASRPLHALAEAFGTVPPDAGPARIEAFLKDEVEAYRAGDAETCSQRIVGRRLDAAPGKPDRLLIYVDQWEELYAMAPAAEDKERLRATFRRCRKIHCAADWSRVRRETARERCADGARGLLQSAHPQLVDQYAAAAPAGEHPGDAARRLPRRDRDAGEEGGTFVFSAEIGRSYSGRRRIGGRPVAAAPVRAEGDLGTARRATSSPPKPTLPSAASLARSRKRRRAPTKG